jgi:hypothetical protein
VVQRDMKRLRGFFLGGLVLGLLLVCIKNWLPGIWEKLPPWLLIGGFVAGFVIALLPTAKSSSDHSPGQKAEIVPKGYWTFWFVVSLLSSVGAFFTAILWWPDRLAIIGVISFCYAIAWTLFYRKMRYGKRMA